MNTDWNDLIQRYIAGHTTEEETRRLETALKADDALADLYLRHTELDVALEAEAASAEATRELLTAPVAPKTRRGFPWLSWRPLAAAALVLLAAGWWLLGGVLRGDVARFGVLHDCRWVDAKLVVASGDLVRRGQLVELSAGRAELVFGSGAVVTLIGPCIFEVESAKGGFLTLGQMKTLAATPESKGFTVRTRTARVVDLGTEFVISTVADGQSRVDVNSGEVDVHLAGVRTPQRLRKGESLSVEAGRAQVMVRIERGDETPAFRFPTIEPPSDRDYADSRQGHARILVAEGALVLPRRTDPNSGSGPVEVLLDGRGQSWQDVPPESVFFQNETGGRLLIDLGSVVSVEKVNTFSWHQNWRDADNRLRAQQQYVLYGFTGDTLPSVHGVPESEGWELVARVNTDEYFAVTSRLDRPAQQGCSISSPNGMLGRYRYLLWIVKPSRLPDFRFLNHTFYGEIDVYANP